eukprot:3051022-Prymnesium_polylepis.1
MPATAAARTSRTDGQLHTPHLRMLPRRHGLLDLLARAQPLGRALTARSIASRSSFTTACTSPTSGATSPASHCCMGRILRRHDPTHPLLMQVIHWHRRRHVAHLRVWHAY